jgi:hypothetical protein
MTDERERTTRWFGKVSADACRLLASNAMTPKKIERNFEACGLKLSKEATKLIVALCEYSAREERERAAKIADAEACRHKEVQHEHTGPHGEAGEEAMMACASVWACEAIAAAIREG